MQKATAGHDDTATLGRAWHRTLEWFSWPAEERLPLRSIPLVLRWVAPVILLFLATLHQIVLQRLWIWLPAAFHLFWLSVGLYALS